MKLASLNACISGACRPHFVWTLRSGCIGAAIRALAIQLVFAMRASAWHQSAHVAMESFVEKHAMPGMRVLDIGGREVNGGAREMFTRRGCAFLTFDVSPHPSVDVVGAPGEPLPFPDATFDVIVSTSTLEHDPMFWMTVREMARVVRVGGLIYANAPSNGPYHGWPGDNYRFYRDAPAALAFWCGRSYGPALPAYPLEVIQHYLGNPDLGRFPWVDNVMVWRRTTKPASNFTLGPMFPLTHSAELGCRRW
eukprot:TRINITY_DN44847_c0_g1_i1.p1 TRINITY_DN44847_c0_g1~~TRINITY_DN44847_c0_g1_i1.p1  ORF type:complete len:251 (-),score=19.60 TRINITY_DN44847_c0_g1_i1:121-873(-)